MNKILRLLALLPLILLLALAPAPNAVSQGLDYHLYLPTTLLPAPSFAVTRIGPFYGRVLGVGQDPFNASVVYAMTFGSGMYKSTNSGASWAPISSGMSYLTLQSMAVDPVNPNVLYAGTYADPAYAYNGVYKSTNGGASWAKTGEMVNYWNGGAYRTPVVYALAVDPNNPNRVFAGTRMKGLPNDALGGGGVFRTENGGVNWEPVNAGLPSDDLYVYDLAIDPSRVGLVYAALHEHGLYRSYDYGGHWEEVTGTWENAEERPWSGRAVTVDPFDSDTLYFGAMKDQGAYRSTDRGATWEPITPKGWDITVGGLSPDPYHRGRLYAGVISPDGDRLMRTTDQTFGWTPSAYLSTWGRIAFAPNGVSAYIGVDGDGAYKTNNGGVSWSRASNGLTGYSVTGLSVSARNPQVMFAALYGRGVYVTKDGGAIWTAYNRGLDTKDLTGLTVDPRSSAVIYVTTSESGVYYTTNGAASWSPLTGGFPSALSIDQPRELDAFENRPLPERDDLSDNPDQPLPRPATLATGLAQANAVAVSPFDSSVLAATSGRGILRLSGTTWVPTGQTGGTAYAILFDRSVSSRVLAAVDGGTGGILASADNGKTWARSNTGIAGRTVYSIAQSPSAPGFFLAGTDSGVYYSTDGGATWTSGGLAGQVVKAVGIKADNLYFAGTSKYAYYTTSFSLPWTTLSPALTGTGVQGIAAAPGGSPQYFFTRLGGIVRVTVE